MLTTSTIYIHSVFTCIYRNLLEKFHGERVKERELETLTEEGKEKIARFNSMISKNINTTAGKAQGQAQGIGFCKGVGFALMIITVSLGE